jgi:hypothetical protein
MGKKLSKVDVIHITDAFIMKKAQLAKSNLDQVVSRYEGLERELVEVRLSSFIQCAERIYELDKNPFHYENTSDNDVKHLRKCVDMLNDEIGKIGDEISTYNDLEISLHLRKTRSWYKFWLNLCDIQKTENSLNIAMTLFGVDSNIYEDEDLKSFVKTTNGSYQGNHRTLNKV